MCLVGVIVIVVLAGRVSRVVCVVLVGHGVLVVDGLVLGLVVRNARVDLLIRLLRLMFICVFLFLVFLLLVVVFVCAFLLLCLVVSVLYVLFLVF